MSRDLVDAIHDVADSAVDTAGTVIRQARRRTTHPNRVGRGAWVGAGLLAAAVLLAIVLRSRRTQPTTTATRHASSAARGTNSVVGADADGERVGAVGN